MHLLRPRFNLRPRLRLRTLLIAVAVIAVALGLARIVGLGGALATTGLALGSRGT